MRREPSQLTWTTHQCYATKIKRLIYICTASLKNIHSYLGLRGERMWENIFKPNLIKNGKCHVSSIVLQIV